MSDGTADSAANSPDLIEDPLTGVASRRYLLTKGTQDISLARRHKEGLALLHFEIDNFKLVYTEHGDETSDKLLQWTASALKSLCRTEDVVSRIRGAAFAILAPRTNVEQALAFCARLRLALADRTFVQDQLRLRMTFSIGIAMLGQDRATGMEDLLAVAAQYSAEAQRAGGNCAVVESGKIASEVQVIAPPSAAGWVASKDAPGEKEKLAVTGLSLERALELLAIGQKSDVRPYVANLIGRVTPLLEFANKEFNLSLGFAIAAMKKRLHETEIEKEFSDD